ncbi:hypothetical protein BS47DRAFT_1327091 [Hydnum rufescens UP504]|uniref:Bulb-type lectin domain-containing protein n=1 Tax=Hydnum rufescens UP504 TaxID=1448309 RepID=A0A9P6B3S2_9AGAM|nr:hypothetical protein BS47DRAFT_1327091 [Hydnum rufescens UP504]
MSDLSHLADRFKNRLGLNNHRPADGLSTYSQGATSAYGSYPQAPYPNYPGPSPPPFTAAYSQTGNYGAGYYPPFHSTPPPIPPRPNLPPPIPPRLPPVVPHRPPAVEPKAKSFAGAMYAPGHYPTPELPMYPLRKSSVLRPSSSSEFNSSILQNALNALGPSSTLYLPRGSSWKIHSPITLHEFQELATEGYPQEEADMAILDAEAECRPHVVYAISKSGVRIRNLIVEGGKEKHGWDKDGGVIIQLGGNAHNQVLDRCVVRNPRHWSCVQAFEGAYNVRITNNKIGPAGVGWDIEEFRWADGISYASSDGLVAGNLITDTTDGAIVLFNAPGTLVTSNTIVTHKRLGLGAINMVDHGVHDGNYGFTRVDHNTIVTAGTLLKIGIGQGCSVWGAQSKRQLIRGGTVINNLITRDLNHINGPDPDGTRKPQLGHGTIGYGYPVGADVAEWTCRDNESDANVLYSGDISSTLPGYLNASPGPFIHDRFGNAEGDEADMASLDLQKEFIVGKVWGLISIRPGESKVLAYDAGGLTLKLGESLQLHSIHLMFREDAEVCVFRPDTGHGGRNYLWEAGSSTRIDPKRPGFSNAVLKFTAEGGKLAIVDGRYPHDVFWDLTPHIPHDAPSLPSRRPNTPRLVVSSEVPYLTITSAAGDLLYASSYRIPRMFMYSVGKFIARPMPLSAGGTLVFTLSPQRQFLVAHTRAEVHSLHWPLDQQTFQVLGSVGDNETNGVNDTEAKLVFQGDGNLVIYTSDGRPTWSTGTAGDREATAIVFGLGSREEPFLELLNKAGARVWST